MKLPDECRFLSCVDVFPLKTESWLGHILRAIGPQGNIFSFYNVTGQKIIFQRWVTNILVLLYNKLLILALHYHKDCLKAKRHGLKAIKLQFWFYDIKLTSQFLFNSRDRPWFFPFCFCTCILLLSHYFQVWEFAVHNRCYFLWEVNDYLLWFNCWCLS